MKNLVQDSNVVDLGLNILAANDKDAAQLRDLFHSNGVKVLNLISAPGTGKTELVVRVCQELNSRECSVGVVVGDCATENDAKRISRVCENAIQIVTQGVCHLEASMLANAIKDLDLSSLDVLLVENVGNLVCPSDFDLGEDLKIALLSVTEGEDKPLKYPDLFSSADLIVVTKMDLVEPCETDMAQIHRNINQINFGVKVVETSARTGVGIEALCDFLLGANCRNKVGVGQVNSNS